MRSLTYKCSLFGYLVWFKFIIRISHLAFIKENLLDLSLYFSLLRFFLSSLCLLCVCSFSHSHVLSKYVSSLSPSLHLFCTTQVHITFLSPALLQELPSCALCFLSLESQALLYAGAYCITSFSCLNVKIGTARDEGRKKGWWVL